jgi:hypothetical protein
MRGGEYRSIKRVGSAPRERAAFGNWNYKPRPWHLYIAVFTAANHNIFGWSNSVTELLPRALRIISDRHGIAV